MKKTSYAAEPGEGKSTRDCIEPWFYAQLRANNDVLPCCWRPAIGKLGPGQSLGDVLNGFAMRKLRYELLTGDLDELCKTCSVRPLTDTETLRTHLDQEMQKETQHRDSSPEQNPEIKK